jgi:hypothetical protein
MQAVMLAVIQSDRSDCFQDSFPDGLLASKHGHRKASGTPQGRQLGAARALHFRRRWTSFAVIAWQIRWR